MSQIKETLNKLLSHLDRLCIIGAGQMKHIIEVPVITNQIGAVFGHVRAPSN
jgi:hypothetical protein